MALGKGLNSLIPQQKSSTMRKQTPFPLAQKKKSEKMLPIQKDIKPVSNGFEHILVGDIIPNPEQPRRHFSEKELDDLVASIKKHGIMQPLTVTERSSGGYELIAGERRLRASKLAGLLTVPALIRKATEQEKLELALIENIQRQDLNPIEEAISYKRLVQDFGLTQQEVSDQVGKSRSLIANTIRLLDLPQEIQQALSQGTISTGKARAILSLKDEQEQMKLYREMTGQQVSVRDVERRVASHGHASRKGSVRRDPNIMAKEQLLEDRLGSKVRISQKGEQGTITIDYYSNDELVRLLEELS